jgi:hypothetical protein
MQSSLHVFQGEDPIVQFDLQPGQHLLGISDDADLILSDARVPGDVCFVDVSPESQVILHALHDVPLRSPDGQPEDQIVLRNGRNVEAAGLSILMLRTPEHSDIQVEPQRTVPVTEKSALIHSPPQETLALLVTTTTGTKMVELDRPRITFGRETGNTVALTRRKVSGRHAAVVQMADGLWIERGSSRRGFG